MAKPNPLQEQLLKAGLVKKSKVAEVAREQHKARHAKASTEPSEIAREAERARAEKAERDRALAQEHKAQQGIDELRATGLLDPIDDALIAALDRTDTELSSESPIGAEPD